MYKYPYLLKIALFLVISISALHLWGQKSTLHGIIVLNESGGEPIQGANIEALGAALTNSRLNGKFKLTFKGKSPGDLVHLNIQKPGFEVVNLASVHSPLPTTEEKILEVIMCQEGEREKYALIYYRLGMEKMVSEKYQQQIAKVTQVPTDDMNVDTITHILQERDKAIQNIDEIARILSQTDLENESDIYGYAIYYFEAGKIDELLALLSDDLLEAKLKKAEALEEKAQLARLQIMQSYVLMANAYFQQNEVEIAFSYFQKAKSIDSIHFNELIAPESVSNLQSGNPVHAKKIQFLQSQPDSLAQALQAFQLFKDIAFQANDLTTLLSGTVRDSISRKGIKGVQVSCCGGLTSVTDDQGNFKLNISQHQDQSQQHLLFYHKKYESASLLFRIDEPEFNVFLQKK